MAPIKELGAVSCISQFLTLASEVFSQSRGSGQEPNGLNHKICSSRDRTSDLVVREAS